VPGGVDPDGFSGAPIEGVMEEKTKYWIFNSAAGFATALGLPVLIFGWHWRPVWAFLLLLALSVVASDFVFGRLAPWWALSLSLIGGVLFTVYVW
jgi:hypothetical protein